jgi:hypothetical protein
MMFVLVHQSVEEVVKDVLKDLYWGERAMRLGVK